MLKQIARVPGFLLFRVIPVIIIAGIIWSGYRVAGDLVRQLDERTAYSESEARFSTEATAIALGQQVEPPAAEETLPVEPERTAQVGPVTDVPTEIPTDQPTDAPTETSIPTETETLPTVTMTPAPGLLVVEATFTPAATETDAPTVTDAPTETSVASNTPQPTVTATSAPSNTPEPTATATSAPSNTPEPTPIPPSETPDQALFQPVTNTPRPLVFATNTPRSVIFATNTPAGGGGGQDQPVIEATATPTPTATLSPTDPPVPTDVPLPTATLAAPTDVPQPTAESAAGGQPTPINTLPPFFFPSTPVPGLMIDGRPVPTEVPLIPREYNLFNVVLLGGDEELTDDGSVRTDTMIVVSVNKDTNTVSMMSFPRDLYVYVPTEAGAMMRLNSVYGFARSFGWQPSAFDLLRRTFAYNFGINVHHYALVNFGGFQEIIDTLGGVPIAVDCAYQDYRLIGAELPDGAVVSEEDEDLYTIDVGYYEMSGAQALWYARTRRSATDFDRGRRQQQILWAMWRQALDTGQLSNLPQLWGQATDVLETSVDVTDVFGLVPIALNLGVSDVRSYTMRLGFDTEPLTVNLGGTTANVQVPVYDNLRPLLEDFYRPPSQSQVLVEGATVAVYDGSGNDNWDRVAAERLGWEGFRASWQGAADAPVPETILIDYTGQTKGSSLNEIAALLNVTQANIRIDPDPNRQADFEVILGANYNSCTYDGVLEVEG